MNSDILVNIEFPKKVKCRMIILISIIAVLFVTCIIFIILYINAKKLKKSEDGNKDTYIPLSLWNNCDAKNKLIEFMKNITTGASFVPKEDRIAVFDLDGTLFQETDLTYDDCKLYYYRVNNDSNYNATDEQKEIANEIDSTSKEGKLPENLIMRITDTYGQLFNNMTLDEYNKYIKNFLNDPSDGYTNIKRGEVFYKPMLEIIEYIYKKMILIFIL